MDPNSIRSDEADSLDFTLPGRAESTVRKTSERIAEIPKLQNYLEWETWLSGFIRETASLPGAKTSLSAVLVEYVKACVSWNEWRPDVTPQLKRAYERYSQSLQSKGFEPMGKSGFAELFSKELKNIPSKLFSHLLKKEDLEAQANAFRSAANANPSDAEIRKLRNLADTLALGRSKFIYEASEKDPENPSVRLRSAVDELAAKIESRVRKASEPGSILTTPVSELVSRALSGIGFLGEKKKKQ